tara:strand:- start:1073 stop:1273 length:201 start_codon:yes stop_codon:yes gene_type:complete
MTKREKIKLLIKENDELKQKVEKLEDTLKDFGEKMNGLLTFCKIQSRQTETEILQSKFNNMYHDDD